MAAVAPEVQQALWQADRLWVLVSACLVFFMQAGFLAVEAGSVREKAAPITAMKNVVDWVACCAFFFVFGWALMFGHTAGGLIGKDFFSLVGDTAGGHPVGLWVHFLFQMAFAGTAATIVSGAMAERTGFVAYVICSVVVTALVYPVVGHWAWGNSFFADNQTWLTKLGFIDFAGSTVVHSVGGWTALVGIMVVGPRLGRFNADGTVKEMKPYSLALTGLGTLMLWFSWWGFNGGSTLALNEQVGFIILNTNIAAAFGGLGALLHCGVFQAKKGMTEKFICGTLAGLVGITANCHMVSPLSAALIGLSSGVLCNVAAELLLKWQLDDPVGAVPVHLVCGVWGTLCVGLFGKADMLPAGHTRLSLLGVQALGIAATGLWVGGMAYAMFRLLRAYVGLRVSPHEEISGYDLTGARETEAAPALSAAEAMALMGEKG